MAEAYVAVRRGPGAFTQRVCVKRIKPDVADDPELVRQFNAEAAVVARLRHAAITQVLDFGRDGSDYYLALELIDGVDLRELIARHPSGLSPALVLYIATELATALDFAHRAGGEPGAGAIVHRDVSSSNVLLSREGEVKLSDFGIARPLDAPQHTRTGIVKGKVPYLAPEYARSGRFDARCDLFSLGVVLYECVSGERPHDGATELETLERAARGERAALGQRAGDAPQALVTQIEALLEADPELRTQSAAQLLEALLAIPGSARARRELGALVSACAAARSTDPKADPPDAVPVGPTERWDVGARDEDAAHAATVAATAASLDVALAGTRVRVGRGPLFALLAALAVGAAVLVFAARRGTPASGATSAGPESAPLPAAEPTLAGTAATAVAAPAASPAAEVSAPAHVATSPAAAPAASPTAEASAPAHLAASPAAASQPSPAGPSPSAASTSPASDAALEVIVIPYGIVSVDGHEVGKAPVSLRLTPGEHAIRARNRDGTIDRRVNLHPGERKQVVLR